MILDLQIADDESKINLESESVSVPERDYEKLRNKPRINGKELVGDVKLDLLAEEKDPTVPDWAKQPTKPDYSAAEVGALAKTDVISCADLQKMWESIK